MYMERKGRHMNRKVEIVLSILLFLCAVSVLVVRFIFHAYGITVILLTVVLCLRCLLWKLEKK